MNILKRNKEIIKRYGAGETYKSIAGDFGITKEQASQYYYDYMYIVNRHFYDIVADMDFPGPIGPKLVHALARYESLCQVTVDREYLKIMNRNDFAKQRAVGKAIMDAFDRMQEALRHE
jgi:hypothetical protein